MEGGVSAYAVAAIRLLMLTGCRRNEILTLQWKDVDLDAGEVKLNDSNMGAWCTRGSIVPCGSAGAGDLGACLGQPVGYPGARSRART